MLRPGQILFAYLQSQDWMRERAPEILAIAEDAITEGRYGDALAIIAEAIGMPGALVPYASRTGTRRNLDALRAAGWRLLVSARGVLRHEGFPYGLDNGAWTAYQRGEPFDEPAFEKALALLARDADWVVVPDIVGKGIWSLEYSLSWLDRVANATLRPLLAVQDGLEPKHLDGFVGTRVGIFVGGTTAWKEQTIPQWAAFARERRAWCHVGRVNTARRISLCTSNSVTSFDGTSASRFVKTLPLLDGARRQLALGLEEKK